MLPCLLNESGEFTVFLFVVNFLNTATRYQVALPGFIETEYSFILTSLKNKEKEEKELLLEITAELLTTVGKHTEIVDIKNFKALNPKYSPSTVKSPVFISLLREESFNLSPIQFIWVNPSSPFYRLLLRQIK